MKKFIIFTLLLANILFSFNKDLLILESKLYPKLFMLIDDYDKKSILNIAIYSDKNEKARFIKKLYTSDKLNAVITKKIDKSFDVILLTRKIDNKTLNNLLKLKKPIFTTEKNNVDYSMFGIYIGVRIYPYLNPYLIKKANLKLNPIIFKVAKIYEK